MKVCTDSLKISIKRQIVPDSFNDLLFFFSGKMCNFISVLHNIAVKLFYRNSTTHCAVLSAKANAIERIEITLRSRMINHLSHEVDGTLYGMNKTRYSDYDPESNSRKGNCGLWWA